jgi:DNA-binding CsgD family transcriptional regulator
LLYGKEVKRPAWFVAERKRAYGERVRRSPRRDEVKQLLLETEMTMEEIGREMGIREQTVRALASAAYRACGVKRREELKEKCGRVGVEPLCQCSGDR